MPEVPFRRIAIVNRGEPAMRLVNAVRDFNFEHGTELATIALNTDADRDSMFVRESDEAYEIGPAIYTDASGQRKVGYLDYERLSEALEMTRADAAWAGWGFVAEQAEFADMCDALGVVFIGPDGNTMRMLGDKITSKRIAEDAGVPVVPWSGGPVDTVDDAMATATRIGYPLMIKATAGGGGRGIRKVDGPDELPALFDSARSEAAGAFGDPTVFLEKAVTAARHIEVQILGDNEGTVWPIGVRDCTVQRRNQKIIEEAPSHALTSQQHSDVMSAAASLGEAAGYRNAGTVEFLYDPAAGEFWFMEVNARLQVEHPITELTTGVDLVKMQLLAASGVPLEGAPPETHGHAIEIRLNAEDPIAGFAPSPGQLDHLRFPVGPGIRVDTGVEQGDAIASEFDSMIAKIMAYGRTREEAVSRLRRALRQTVVVVRDGATNKAFVELLLADPIFMSGDFDIGWVDALTREGGYGESSLASVAIVAAAIAAYEEEIRIDRGRFKESANRGRPIVDADIGKVIGLRYRGNSYEPRTRKVAQGRYRVDVSGETVDAAIDESGRLVTRITVGGQSHRLLSLVESGTHRVEVDGVPHRIGHDEGGVIRAPSPSVVVGIAVADGDRVERGQRLAVIEAMKMETQISAPFPGTVREVVVRENTQVGTGAPLMVLEPEGGSDESQADTISFVDIASFDAGGHVGCEHQLERIAALMLGYDVDPAAIAGSMTGVAAMCHSELGPARLQDLENQILEIFVDIISLFRRVPTDDELSDVTRRSSQEYLYSYLKDPTTTEGLPGLFTERLGSALAHYGVNDDSSQEDRDTALYRIATSHERMSGQVGVVLTLLDRRLSDPGNSDEAFRDVLDAMIYQTRDRYPAVHDLAREVSYVIFDEPFLTEVRAEAYREADRQLALLEQHLGDPSRADHIRALVDCPQPLTGVLSRRFRPGRREANSALLEVMFRRYYRIRALEHVEATEVDGLSAVTGQYELDGAHIDAIAIHVLWNRLEEGVSAIASVAADRDPEHDVIADLFVWNESATGSPEVIRDVVLAALDRELGDLQLRRIIASVASPTAGTSIGGVLNFTFRSSGDGTYREETLYRDLHPMMGKRLRMERLEAFDVERIPTLEDIYVFHGVARDNASDERLLAFAEVRDLTPIRNEHDEVVRLPEFERVFHDVLGSIRRFQAHRPTQRRLHFNRAMLYVWPPLDLARDEIGRLIDRLGRVTEGIGLQQVDVVVRVRTAGTGKIVPSTLEFFNPGGGDVSVRLRRTRSGRIEPLSPLEQKIARLRQRALHHPADIIEMLTRGGDQRSAAALGTFQEYDLVDGELEPVDREIGQNETNVVVGTMTNPSETAPEGMKRVILIGDPTSGMGNVAEGECIRIIAAMGLAERERIPLEWFAVSAGARISMDSGTENMDWIGLVLRRLIEFTQAGGEVNIVVTGINVGAQPYWNAEATMLMHTKGILVMMPQSAMVLTGKEALDYSGGVSAEDNQGIGGYERIMGPNGQAQYFARDIPDACSIVLRHYEATYVSPGERFPRRTATTDPTDRNVEDAPHGGEFAVVGEVFSETTNPGRKKPFDIRQIMAAVVDRDHAPMERWYGMQHAEVAVSWDARIGGHAVALLGFESRPIKRAGFVPADGPDRWTSGTLFPVASKKVARTINAASGNRPLVVLANLSGFDGSPESMRNLQLEYGAEIGRAVVNFDGPIVFVVISRYHGGAFVVFSNALHDNMEIAAIEGSHASVIGGAPAAAVVFAREVRARTDNDPRVVEAVAAVHAADGSAKAEMRSGLARATGEVRSEKLGEVADEFDAVHDINRALAVGSVHAVIAPADLRPYLVQAIERGMERELESSAFT